MYFGVHLGVFSNRSFGLPTYDTAVKWVAKAYYGCPLPVCKVGDRSAVALVTLLLESIFWVEFGPNFTFGVHKVFNYR